MVTESIIENIIICNPKQVEVSSGAVEFRWVCGTGYAKYFGIDNGKKADLINLSEPIQKVLQIPVNKDLRNGIGHNNYKYDGLMQTITTFDYRRGNRIKLQESLMDVALDCIGLAKASVILGEVVLFILGQELWAEDMHSTIYPRFYKRVWSYDKCPCGSGMKYKKCYRNDITTMKPVS